MESTLEELLQSYEIYFSELVDYDKDILESYIKRSIWLTQLPELEKIEQDLLKQQPQFLSFINQCYNNLANLLKQGEVNLPSFNEEAFETAQKRIKDKVESITLDTVIKPPPIFTDQEIG